MINKNKLKKLVLLSIMLILTMNVNVNKVNAAWGGTGSGGSGGGGGKGGGYSCPENITAYCSVSSGIEYWSYVYPDMYDRFGNKLPDILDVNQKFLAGTYVGLDVYEKKGYNSWASYSLSAIQTYYVCTRIVWDYWPCKQGVDAKGKPIFGTCSSSTTYQHEALHGCPAGYDASRKTRAASPCGAAVQWCSKQATPPTIPLEPSYNITYEDSNDIGGGKTNDIYNTKITMPGGKCTTSAKNESNGNKNTSSNECIFYYNREDSCINVKNGKVRYVEKNESCNSETEYRVTPVDEYWKYFIPLNANSKNDFSFSMTSSGNKEQAEICKDMINKYPNYYEMIIDQNKKPFTGNESKTNALKRVQSGCYFQSSITIPVEQKFYNELEDQITFKGFNFYYKPIDINEPFPNGLTNTSIWYDWYKDNNKELDLTESYHDITYIAQISDLDAIREYTKNNPYTNWYNMYVNGTSSFIEKEGIITRYVDRDSYYALGCGPWNENKTNKDGSKNPFYQPECDNS